MNYLSWFLYLADVFGTLKLGTGILFFVAFIPSMIFIIPGYLATWRYANEEDLRIRKNMAWIAPRGIIFALILGVISTFVPSKETMYLISASEIGEVVVSSSEAKEVYSELKSVIMDNLKSMRNETTGETTK